jgi:hypothetical protein
MNIEGAPVIELPAAARERGHSYTDLIALTLLLALLVAVWSVHYPLSNDGASHIHNAIVTRDLLLNGAASPYSPHIRLNPALAPNWGSTLLVMPLAATVSPSTALKCAVTLVLVLMFLSGRYFLGSMTTSAVPVGDCSLLALFMANNWFLWMGFWGFCLATAGALFTLGWVKRRLPRWRWPDAVALGALIVLIGFAHPVPAIFVSFGVVMLIYGDALEGDDNRPATVRKYGSMFAAALMSAWPFFLARQAGGGAILNTNPKETTRALLNHPADSMGMILRPWADQQYFIGALMVAAIIAGMDFAGPRMWRRPGFAFAAGSAILFCARVVTADAQSGGGFVGPRLSYFSLLLLIVWLWPNLGDARLRTAIRSLLLVSIAITTAVFARSLRQADAFVNELTSAAREAGLQAGGTSLLVRYESPVIERFYDLDRFRTPWLARQSIQWITLERKLIDLTNYEILEDNFPNRLRPGSRALVRALQNLMDVRARQAESLDTALAAEPVTYVTLLGENGVDWIPSPAGRSVFDVLKGHGYTLLSERGTPVFIRFFSRAQENTPIRP